MGGGREGVKKKGESWEEGFLLPWLPFHKGPGEGGGCEEGGVVKGRRGGCEEGEGVRKGRV